jgi:hypothetical protein
MKEEVMKASFPRSLRFQWAVSILLVLSAPVCANATALNYNPPTVRFVGNPCGSFAGYSCYTTAYFDPTSLDAQNGTDVSVLFQDAFNVWNATQGDTWSLDLTTADPGGTFNITGDPTTNPAAAGQFGGVTLGGLTIEANLSGLTLPALGAGDQLLWLQGLQINYTPGPNAPTVAPYYTMDTSTLSGLVCDPAAVKGTGDVFCPPAYPFQYANNMFYDQPKAFYQTPGTTQAFFNADAYLAVENTNTDTVELLDGFSYGFQNSVSPEPGSFVLLGTGLLGLAGLVRRKIGQRA